MRKKLLTRLGAVVAGGALSLMAAAPALADGPININPGNIPATAEGFGGDDCRGPLADLPENVDGWHFVTGSNENFTSLTLTFDTPDGEVTVFVDSTDPENPSENADPFWSGFIGEPLDEHAWVMTEAGWTLTDGEATVDVVGQAPQFQLSHTCAGVPDKKPSPSPSTTPSTTPSTEPPGEDDEEPELPVTGAQVGGLLVLAGGLLAAGVAMLAVRRRRNLSDLLEG